MLLLLPWNGKKVFCGGDGDNKDSNINWRSLRCGQTVGPGQTIRIQCAQGQVQISYSMETDIEGSLAQIINCPGTSAHAHAARIGLFTTFRLFTYSLLLNCSLPSDFLLLLDVQFCGLFHF